MLSDREESIPLDGGFLRVWSNFLSPMEAADFFERIHATTAWEQTQIRIAGKLIPIPRLNAWYGDPGADYSYSGVRLQTLPWSESLRELKERVEGVTGLTFNSALVNLYRDERDSVDWHSDDEPELGPSPQVASLSLGEQRRFELRRKDNHRQKLALNLSDGSLLLMAGELQHCWQHRLGKEKHPCRQRINITFRKVHNRT